MSEKQESVRSVFYSWQSELPAETNRAFIEDALTLAIEANATKTPLELSSLDRAPGAPNIGRALFGRIASSDAFVADVSTVARGDRATPNPNVMLELGYAMHCLGEERIVLLFNEAHGSLADIPFDLRQNRILSYACRDPSARQVLAANLENQLRVILALPPRNTLDVRVFVNRGVAGMSNFSARTVSIDVQNHSPSTVFLSVVEFELADGQWLYVQNGLVGPNVGQRVESGDSYSFVITEQAFRSMIAKNHLVAAAARDKLGRRWSSDRATFQRLLQRLRSESA